MTDPLITEQLNRATGAFAKRYGRAPTIAAAAPGRVNLIGEHTDYNDGFVLPMAVQRQTVIALAPSNDTRVRIHSNSQDADAEWSVAYPITRGEPAWANYVKGVVAGFQKLSLLPGFDAVIDTTVPLGGGLSSSASLEVAVACALEMLTQRWVTPTDKAKLCQKAEHEYAGVPCGIMDQSIAVLAQTGHAMLLDCRSMATRMVPLKDPKVAVLIANTNVKHALTGGEYAERRRQCEAAAKALGKPALRDATMADLLAARTKLDDTTFRRARHVIGEIARTTSAADAAGKNDWSAFGQLMLESHASLRDDFEVSCAELDTMVEVARKLMPSGGVIGTRMTGGGFGGCTVSLVQADRADRVASAMHDGYRKATGIDPTLFVTRPAAGASGWKL